MTTGMWRAVSWSRCDSVRPQNTVITPVGRRLSTSSIHVRPGVWSPWQSEITTATWCSSRHLLDTLDDLDRIVARELVEDQLQ